MSADNLNLVAGTQGEMEDSTGTQRAARRGLFGLAWSQKRVKIGSALLLVLVIAALFGPLVAPHAHDAPIGAPYTAPSEEALLGTDNLGRDVLSRFLHGGRTVLTLSIASTGLGLALGIAVGLLASLSGRRFSGLIMRTMDVLLAFPAMLLPLIAIAVVGPELWVIVVLVAIITVPRVARIVRGSAEELVQRDFVLAARSRGEGRGRILLDEVFPNLLAPLVVIASFQLSGAVALVAGLSFLGLGLQPPTADWGLMINENRLGIQLQPWGVLVPVLAIAFLTVGTCLVGDGLSRAAMRLSGGGGDGGA